MATTSVWGLNEKGELVATAGTGSSNVVGWLNEDFVPTDSQGRLIISGLSKPHVRNVGTPLWTGQPTAGLFLSIKDGTGTTLTPVSTSDGGMQVTATTADQYIDLVLTLPGTGILAKSVAVEMQVGSAVNLVSAYFGTSSSFGTQISRTLTTLNTGASETHRTGAKAHLWFTGTAASAWTNSSSLDLDVTLFTHFRIRITPSSGQVATGVVYNATANPVGRSRIAVVSDDGWLGWYRYAMSILQRRGITSTYGVIPALVGVNSNYANLQQLKNFVAAGNECIAHGPNTTNQAVLSLFDGYSTTAQRIADIAGVQSYLKTNGLAGDAQLKCYVFPTGKYTAVQGDVSLLDAMADQLGITLGRTVTRSLGFSSDIAKTNKYSSLTVPIIGYIRQATEAADIAELNTVLNDITYCAQNGLDAVIMLHNVIPPQSYSTDANPTLYSPYSWTASTDITANNLVKIADALVAARSQYGAEIVPFSTFAP